MPTYLYVCEKCSDEREEFHKMTENPDIMCKCGEKMARGIIHNYNGFVLKGTGWGGKDHREKRYRLKKRRDVGKRMVRNHDNSQILPNYKGEVCDTWEQAKSLAKEDGVNERIYEKKVETLKKQ